MFIEIFSKIAFQLFIVSGLTVSIFCLQAPSAWPQEPKPRAVVMGQSSSSIADISEQILLQKLRNELAQTYDFSAQPAFEQALLKLEQISGEISCQQLKCMLEVQQSFPQTILFLLKSQPEEKRLTLVMVGENQQWRVKHEVCSQCRLTQEELLTSVVLRMEGYAKPPMAVVHSKPQKQPKSLYIKPTAKEADLSQKEKTEAAKVILKPKSHESEIVPAKKVLLPLEQLKFKIAQRRYNKLIWNKIKKDLMFFRQKNHKQSLKNLKTRVRLQIDQYGKVVERRLIEPSGSQKFDEIILDSVDLLKLPPPMDLLIHHPPYVVTILIQP